MRQLLAGAAIWAALGAGAALAQDGEQTPPTPPLDVGQVEAQADEVGARDRAIEAQLRGAEPLDPSDYESEIAQLEERDAQIDAATPTPMGPSGITHRAYQLYAEIDIPILLVATVLSAQRLIERNSHPGCEGFLDDVDPNREGDQYRFVCTDEEDLFFLDRPFAGLYDRTWAMATDIGILSLFGAWIGLTTIDQGIANALNDAVVILESSLLASALSSMSVVSTGRGRPFAYGTEAPYDARGSDNAALSFFSGHTALAFAMATSIFWTFERIHPDSGWRYVVAVALGSVATFVGVGRVLAGAHFPTDVAAGAAVGIGIGTLIPALHDSPLTVSVDSQRDHALLQVGHRF